MTVARWMDHTSIDRSAFSVYFRDIHHLARILPGQVGQAIQRAANPSWLAGVGEPVPALYESLRGLVEVCVEQGLITHAVFEATAGDARLEPLWNGLVGEFDEAVWLRLRAEQRQGRVGALGAPAMARALNRLDGAYLIDSFGRCPQPDPDQVLKALTAI